MSFLLSKIGTKSGGIGGKKVVCCSMMGKLHNYKNHSVIPSSKIVLSQQQQQCHKISSSSLLQKTYRRTNSPMFCTTTTRRNNIFGSRTLSSYYFSTATTTDNDNENEPDEPREIMPFDVLIVGGGPAGLAASIRLKQLCLTKNIDLSVCLIDKGSEIGSHIISGNVFDPKAMYELFPERADKVNDPENYWIKDYESIISDSKITSVKEDCFKVLTESGKAYTIPNILLPNQLHNDGNYIISLSQLCRYLATKAEEMGVEIYPGFAASEVLIREDDKKESHGRRYVRGIATRDVGLTKDGITRKSTFERGVELHARMTLFAEGARGSCSESIMKEFHLRDNNNNSTNTNNTKPTTTNNSNRIIHNQSYGLGIKEVWQIPPEKLKPGYVQHTIGYPLQSSVMDKVYGGSFLYHQEPDLVLVGLVVGLDYENPYLNPYQEFQKWKTHPDIAQHLQDGTCISYGARVLNEGGYHSIPHVTFPGGALIGCSAGFLNAVKIKGSHTAMKSGMLAAEATFEALTTATTKSTTTGSDESIIQVAESGEIPENESPIVLTQYEKSLEESWIYKELYEVRNSHAAFSKWGIGGGLVYTGFTTHISKGREPWTLSNGHHGGDCDATKPMKEFQPIDYPTPDNKLTFDLLTNLQRSGTYHTDDQPIHLRIKPELQHIPSMVSYPIYGGPEQRFCPAGVYEYVDDDDSVESSSSSTTTSTSSSSSTKKKLVINSQNCIHCKCCSIKMSNEYIDWTVPEGGGGPQYQVM